MKPPAGCRRRRRAFRLSDHVFAVLASILIPAAIIAVLIVVTAINAERHDIITIEVGEVSEAADELTEMVEEEEKPFVNMSVEVDSGLELNIDDSTLPPIAEVPALETTGLTAPNPSTVLFAPSPVTMKAIAGGIRIRGLATGEQGGFGALIGAKDAVGVDTEGCMTGMIIDFKRDAKGKPRANYVREGFGRWSCPDYWKDIGALLKADFSPAALSKYFIPDRRIVTSHIFIRKQEAANGPAAFGVADTMESCGFVVYYDGTITPAESGRYRFVGYFDDVIIVRINRKVVLEDDWALNSAKKERKATGWKPTDAENCGKWPSIQGMASTLTPGEWVKFEAGKKYKIEILVGENGGGYMGGVLFIQKEGAKYEFKSTKKTQRPILPVFSTRPLSFRDKDYIKSYSYPMSVDPPLFFKKDKTKMNRQIMKGDVGVDVDI